MDPSSSFSDDYSNPPPTIASASDESLIPSESSLSSSMEIPQQAQQPATPQTTASSAASAASTPSLATSSSTVAPEKSGWMQKNSYTNPSIFNSYWFVLQENQLNYYVSEEATTPKGTILLEGCSCEIVPESKYSLSACFELNSPVQGRLYALACDATENMQLWINVIRSTMLRIRRSKAKQAAAAKRQAVQHAAQESQLSQQQYRETQQALAANANGSSVTSTSSPSSSTLAYANSYHPDSSSASATQPTPLHSHNNSVSQNSASSSSNGYNPATGLGGIGAPASGDDAETKYTIYRQWLDETKGTKGKGGNSVGGMSTSRVHGSGELHHTLLDEEKKISFWEKTFGPCCPAWCFR